MVNKKLLLVVLLCGSVAIGAAAISVAVAQEDAGDSSSTIDEAFRADILKMLKLSGADKLGEQVFQQMITSLRPLAPNVPEEFWTQINQEFDMNKMIDLLIPVYAKHLTHEDVQAAIAFYEKHGFEKGHQRPGYYRNPVEDALVMVRHLAQYKQED